MNDAAAVVVVSRVVSFAIVAVSAFFAAVGYAAMLYTTRLIDAHLEQTDECAQLAIALEEWQVRMGGDW